MADDHIQISRVQVDASAFDRRRRGTHREVIVEAGHRGRRRVVPPAGDDYAFDVDEWARRVVVSVSPTGRSVRVFVDGQEIPPHTPTPEDPT